MCVNFRKWICTGCDESLPCTGFGVESPHGCIYRKEENCNWSVATENIEPAAQPPFDDIKEFLKPTANDRYMTALEVFREFLDNTDGGINGPFQQWCRDWSWRTNRGV